MKKIMFILCLSLFACSLSDNDDTVCTEELRPGLIVSVRDASNNTVLDNATITARDGDFEETLMELSNPVAYTGVFERPGVYTLTVEREGFQTLTSDPILVQADICHVITVQVNINLQPNN
ncbi:hypothetical protein GTQ40_08815 [Flavobacteriaceae bacterium R38]|nr:hypothetical protein [Flavobacteriaceae bacterium R38]